MNYEECLKTQCLDTLTTSNANHFCVKARFTCCWQESDYFGETAGGHGICKKRGGGSEDVGWCDDGDLLLDVLVSTLLCFGDGRDVFVGWEKGD